MDSAALVLWWARVHSPPDAVEASHALALRAASAVLEAPQRALTLAHRCPRCGSTDHGTPFVVGADVAVSLSRTPGAVIAVASLSASLAGIGVDIERLDRASQGLRDVAMSPTEVAALPTTADASGDLRVWVRKEAMLKALGTGLATDPRSITLAGTTVVHGPQGPWWLHDVALADGFAATVAARGALMATVLVSEATTW